MRVLATFLNADAPWNNTKRPFADRLMDYWQLGFCYSSAGEISSSHHHWAGFPTKLEGMSPNNPRQRKIRRYVVEPDGSNHVTFPFWPEC